MALQNDPRVYSGGSERIDTRPHTMLYAQLMQRKQAKDAAVDDYVRNLNKNVNPAGMRNQEREVFEQKLKDWQRFGVENKDKLRNPRGDKGEASMEFQARYQDIMNLINESKGEEEKKKPLVEIMTDPNKRDRLNEEEIFPKINLHDKPLYTKDELGNYVRDEERKSFNVADLNFNPKPFEQDKFFQGLDDVKPSQSSESVVKNPKDLTKTVITTSVFTPSDRNVIASRAVAEYGQNKSFKDFVDNLDPSEYNDIHKQAFGDDIQNGGDLAAAYALKGKQQTAVATKIEEDAFAQRKALLALNDAYSKGRMYMRRAWSQADKATQDSWVDGQLEGIVAKGKQGGEVVYTDQDGNKRLGYNVPLDANMAQALSRDKEQPDALRLNSDNTFTPIFLLRDAKGNPVQTKGTYEVDKIRSVPLTYPQIKAAYSKQFGTKQANLEMGGMDGEEGGSSSSGSSTIGILD